MKVLLLSVPLMDQVGEYLVPIAMDRIRTNPPLGIYWLAGLLRERGHDVAVLDLIALGNLDEAQIKLGAGKADLVGISTNSLNWPTARIVCNLVKQDYPSLPVVLGGIHPGSFPEHVLAACEADYLIRGEGETPLLYLIEALEGKRSFDQVPGLGRRDGQGGVLIQDIDALSSVEEIAQLPDPAYDLLPAGAYEALSVESARGCRFRCTFCSTKLRGTWRGQSAGDFVDQLERLMPYFEKTKYPVFSFVDDLYTHDIQRVKDITAEILRRDLPVKATIDGRASDLVRAGVIEAIDPLLTHMLVGAECGYDSGLKRIRKGCSTAILEKAAAMLREAEISPNVVFSFIVGFPFERREDCLRTIEFASNLMVKYGVRIYLQWFNTIPGSEMWEELARQTGITIDMYDHFGFFQNERLFRAGVQMPLHHIEEISDIVKSINTLFLFTQPATDIIQFNRPDWLLHEASLKYPSGPAAFVGGENVPL